MKVFRNKDLGQILTLRLRSGSGFRQRAPVR